MAITAEQADQVLQRAECLYDRAQVEAALARMADEIGSTLAGTDPLLLVVMTGGFVTASELALRLDFPLQVDYLHATRYGDLTTGTTLRWVAEPHSELAGRTVLVVDDILDEGQTLEAILDFCRRQGAGAVYSAVLVDKRHNRRQGLQRADFTALTVPDRYVFGYGMDYKGYWRNCPAIYAAHQDDE